jgi:hypothetical protein
MLKKLHKISLKSEMLSDFCKDIKSFLQESN